MSHFLEEHGKGNRSVLIVVDHQYAVSRDSSPAALGEV
jgi:hypothetical protein